MTRRVMVASYSNRRILEAIATHGYDDRVKLLALGDSWFAFPLPLVGGSRNLIDAISTAKKTVAIDISMVGDTAENMAQGDRFAQHRAILAGGDGEDPIEVAAILLSAGGNDLIDRIADLVGLITRQVKRAAAGRAAAPETQREAFASVLRAVTQEDAARIYDDVLAHVRKLIAARDDGPSRASPVVLQGYCHVTPRDAPAVDFPIKVGPWIWKKLTPLGYTQPQQQKIAAAVIDEFNSRLAALRDEARGVYVLDLRPLQAPGGPLPVADPESLEPTTFWHDEIHLNSAGWDCVASNLLDPLLDRLL
jgi:hypothetical protein